MNNELQKALTAATVRAGFEVTPNTVERTYQIVVMRDDRILPSRLKSGIPNNWAVAAIARSGRSGMSSRGTSVNFIATASSRGNRFGVADHRVKIIQPNRRNSRLLNQAHRLSKADGGNTDMISGRYCLIDEGGSRLSETGIGKQMPDRGMGISYGNDRRKSERGKLANISVLF